MTDRDRLILEESEKMCEYCCNFDKEHIGMDCTALCKLTMTLAYAEDYGGNCMFYNVPKERIIVPPCKVGDMVFAIKEIVKACKDCLHYEACKGTYSSAKGDEDILYDFDGEMYANSGCEDFQDKNLINRLQAENEELKEKNKELDVAVFKNELEITDKSQAISLLCKNVEDARAENERLKPFEDKFAEFNSHIRVEDMLVCASSLGEWLEFCDNLKAEAYKECIEKIKTLFPSYNEPYQYWEIHEGADNLLKELVGE